MNFIALGVIAEIDDIYANTLYNSQAKKMLEESEENNIKMVIKEFKPAHPSFASKCHPFTWIHGVLRCFYECYYYYFMPFTVIVLTFFQDLDSNENQWYLLQSINSLNDKYFKNEHFHV